MEGRCIQKFYKEVGLYGSECNGEQIKRTWMPENINLKKRFKRSIMFFSSINFGSDSEGKDMDQEQVDEKNNFLEEKNEATEIEDSVDHTQYFVPCQG